MNKRVTQILVSAFITALMLFAVFSESGFSGLGQIFQSVDYRLLSLYAGLSIFALIVRAIRYGFLLKALVPEGRAPSFGKVLAVTAVRNALVDFLPARLGEASYLYLLNRFGVPLLTGVSSFGICLVMDVAVLFFLLCLALLTSGLIGSVFIELANPFSVGLLLLVLVAVLSILFIKMDALLQVAKAMLLSLRAALERRLGSKVLVILDWSVKACGELSTDFNRAKESRVLFKLLVTTALLRGAKYGSLFVLLLAVVAQWNIGASVLNAGTTMVAFVFAEGAASLPISGVMGFGMYEGTWAAVFSLACGALCDGLPLASIALVAHAITQMLGYFIGILGGLAFLIHELHRNQGEKAR